MDLTKKIVTAIPVSQLWVPGEILELVRGPYITKRDIQEQLNVQPIRFVIANIGEPLEWIPVSDCYSFWKKVLKSHVADHHENIYLDSFPDQYAFLASQWSDGERMSVVLLEKIH